MRACLGKARQMRIASTTSARSVAVWVSIRSTSWNVIVPVGRILARRDIVSSVTPPSAVVDAAMIVGASLVPVIVTVTSWVTVPPMMVVDS